MLNDVFDGFSANISRSISRSYCGSEISETDYYSPYSFYGGSEAGTDVAAGDLVDPWGGQTVRDPMFHSSISCSNFILFSLSNSTKEIVKSIVCACARDAV